MVCPFLPILMVKPHVAGAPRLPGFHTCVGGGGDKQTPEWYEEKGALSTHVLNTSWPLRRLVQYSYSSRPLALDQSL